MTRCVPGGLAKPRALAVIAVGALALGALPAASAEPTVTIQGSTTFARRIMEPHRRLIEERAGLNLDVIANKSVHGLIALLEGRTRMAMISSSLEGEQKHLRAIRPDLPIDRLQSVEIARTRIAFITHPSNPVRSASLENVARVLRGEIASWKALGGDDEPIAVVTVQPGGGVPTTVRMQLLSGGKLTPGRLIVVEAPTHVVTITSQHTGALGIAQLGLSRSAAVQEIVTDAPVEQILNYVTLGAPAGDLLRIIEATRDVAREKLD